MSAGKPDLVPENMFRHVRFNLAVRVPLHAYLQFNRRMDRQLRELVERWAPLAAPSASFRRRHGPLG